MDYTYRMRWNYASDPDDMPHRVGFEDVMMGYCHWCEKDTFASRGRWKDNPNIINKEVFYCMECGNNTVFKYTEFEKEKNYRPNGDEENEAVC